MSTDLPAGIHLFTMPMCSACKRWKSWLDMERLDFTEHPLADLAADIGSSIPDALNASQARRRMNDELEDVAPVVVSVHGDGKVVLIADGTEPEFWGSDEGFLGGGD